MLSMNLWDGMYWCMATMTSVGYGDLYPVTLGGQIVGILAALSGTIIILLPLAVISNFFQEEYLEQQRIARRNALLLEHNARVKELRENTTVGSIRSFLSSPTRKLSLSARSNTGLGSDTSSSSRGSSLLVPAAAREAAASEASAAAAGACGENGQERVTGVAPSPPKSPLRQPTLKKQPTRSKQIEKLDLLNPEHVPGLVECEWLLEEYRQEMYEDVRALLRKGENDLMRMARKVIIHSRIVAKADAIKKEELDERMKKLRGLGHSSAKLFGSQSALQGLSGSAAFYDEHGEESLRRGRRA